MYCFKEQHNAMINIIYPDLCSIHLLSSLQILAHLIFTTTLWDNYFQYFNFTDKLTDVQKNLQVHVNSEWHWCHLNLTSLDPSAFNGSTDLHFHATFFDKDTKIRFWQTIFVVIKGQKVNILGFCGTCNLFFFLKTTLKKYKKHS